MKRKQYPVYKDSGVPWLGRVPEHWGVSQLRWAASVRPSNVDKLTRDDEQPVALCNYVDVYKNEKITSALSFMQASASKDQIERFSLKPSDVIVTKDSETPDDIAVPALVSETLDGVVCGYHLALLRPDPREIFGPYLFRFLQSHFAKALFSTQADGVTRFGLPRSALNCCPLPLPSLGEQQAIADFLDRETAKTDALIEKKRRLIELLKEKRAALITQAVTRGLNPTKVPLKNSGVPWLGQIPAHWTVKRLKHLISSVTSGSRGWAEYYSSEGSLFVRIGNLTRDSIEFDFEDVQYVDPPIGAEGQRTRIKSGDVLISITAYLGSVAVADARLEGAYVNQHIALTRPRAGASESRWLGYSLLSHHGQAQLGLSGYGGTKVQLGLEEIKELWLALPPISEQERILKLLNKTAADFKRVIQKIHDACLRLAELRSALISTAVTGKIDLRH